MNLIICIIFILQVVLFFLVIFSKSFVKGWVEGSIKEHFEKASEKRSYEQQTRLKAELVAELLAEWLTAGADRKKLRELNNKAFLWLPKDIAMQLSELLTPPSNISVEKVLTEVRAHLLGEQGEDKFDPDEIVSFPLTQHERNIRRENDVNN
ncbi:hypothetical protein F3J27_09045 [Enterobacter sp. Ap-916]|uniref:hypothetical protein n=1 Tax=unclassified Enterobacter TaxID=2608935 RepID=UPI001422C73C|nr:MULTISPECIES: hypothetical protein [unclassified Enterobacter]NIF58957.1 hypothetical protein [Enterobacter sp. Ap-867]NIG29627.1 hypothetical protein [Enterobacter sp. Ap-916]